MAKDTPIEDHREKPRRRIEGSHDGTRSGLERRRTKEEEWAYFDKRTNSDRRTEDDRRSGSDRREE